MPDTPAVPVTTRQRVRRWTRRHRRATWLLVVVAVAAIVAIVVALDSGGSGPRIRTTSRMVAVVDGPARDQHVRIDTTLFVPATATTRHPAPAIVLAHGFGGSKDDLRTHARELARRGFVVLTYSARGFGHSTGTIALDAPDYEVRDVEQLIDMLSRRRDVLQDSGNDPRVGMVGASYGGGIALQVAARDARVDAIVPSIAWNDLVSALAPNMATTTGVLDPRPRGHTRAWSPSSAESQSASPDGVFKRSWAGVLFSGGQKDHVETPTICGNFRAELCAAYEASATAGRLTPRTVALLSGSSPAGQLRDVRAATMLVQGETDSLFPPSEGDKTAREIARAHVPLKVVWQVAGHDGDGTKDDAKWVTDRTNDWLDRYLWRRKVSTGPAFEFGRPGRIHRGMAGAYGGLSGGSSTTRRTLALHGRTRTIVRPPGGSPAALSTVPGSSAVAALAGALSELPTQHANFETRPLRSPVDVLGASQVRVAVSSPSGDTSVVLFAKLYDVSSGGGAAELPERLASPMRVALPQLTASTASDPGDTIDAATGQRTRQVIVALPAISHRFEAGHRMRVTFSTTDQAYAAEPTAQTVRVALVPGSGLVVPTAPAGSIDIGDRTLAGTLALALLALLALAGIATALVGRRRHARQQVVPIDHDVVLELRGLTKTWDDGLRAVDDLTFRVERGQVLGLLGPNGAGKTTALRMAMGLIHPDAGEVRVLGQHVSPGAPVLGRVGSFVEGAGFLPHLSGRRNLELYWRASGRPRADAHVVEALEIAGLGTAIDKPVRTYSQGMRQRLAIAQAMLGLPDLLVLDEPTNGLDPPQIREMREVVRTIAATGRTVIVSSHLLGEVQQTCTHVVVMHRGRLIASGPVAELLVEWSDAGHASLEDAFMHILAREEAPA